MRDCPWMIIITLWHIAQIQMVRKSRNVVQNNDRSQNSTPPFYFLSFQFRTIEVTIAYTQHYADTLSF